MRIVVRALALAGVAALAVVAASAVMNEAPTHAAPPSAAAPAAGFRPLPSASAEAGPALLARSPFAPDRSAYARPASEAPIVVERPLDVRLVAVSRAEGAMRATLRIDGTETTVGVGEATSAGVVAAIEADAVIFDGADGRRVGLFE